MNLLIKLRDIQIILSTVNVAEQQKEIDKLSKEYRLIDTKLQGLNWTTDIIS